MYFNKRVPELTQVPVFELYKVGQEAKQTWDNKKAELKHWEHITLLPEQA